jgi:hypothetical protein
MRKILVTMAAAMVAIGTLGAASSGFPSRPRLQALGVNMAPPAAAGGISAAGTVTSAGVQTQSIGIGAAPLGAAGGMYLLGSYPSFSLQTTAAITANQKRWLGYVDDTNGSFCIATQTDAGTATAFPWCIHRSGTTPTKVDMPNRVDVGTLAVTNNTGAAIVDGVGIAWSGGESYVDGRTSNTLGPLNLRGSVIKVNNQPLPRVAGAICTTGGCTATISFGASIAFISNVAGTSSLAFSGFTATPACTANASGAAGAVSVTITSPSSTGVLLSSYTTSTGAAVGATSVVTCIGS